LLYSIKAIFAFIVYHNIASVCILVNMLYRDFAVILFSWNSSVSQFLNNILCFIGVFLVKDKGIMIYDDELLRNAKEKQLLSVLTLH
jgi:hypothetical protein